MTNNTNWILPDGVEEILPNRAEKLELLRRQLLDAMLQRDYKLVMPPVMEFVDSLLTGTGQTLDTQTYKFMDNDTQRMLGIRADMTPQIARIDAHYLADNDINRLCYAGTVLRTRPTQMGGSRELLQIGAEIFGVEDETADIQIIETMLEVLGLSKLNSITLSLGHVGIYRDLIDSMKISHTLEQEIFDVLLRKSLPDLSSLQSVNKDTDLSVFKSLLELQGDISTLDKASEVLPKSDEISTAISQLRLVTEAIRKHNNKVNIHIDLADVHGYQYHTGLVYSAFVENEGRAIAKGGRYDGISELFGRKRRPATGFSADLKALIRFVD